MERTCWIVAGALDTGGGVFALGAGNDTFVVHDSAAVTGTVDGGLGNDLLNVTVSSGNTVPLGSMLGFESLGKSGQGALQINGPSTFIDVNVMAGLLEISAGGSVSAQNTTVSAGSTLRVDGNYTGTAGNDTMLVAGTITGAGTVALGDGTDSFTIQDGANLAGLATPVDGGAGIDAFIADLAGSATLGGAVNFETLSKTNTGTLHVDGPALSAFSIVNVNGGTLDIGTGGSIAGAATTSVNSGATFQVDGSYAGSAGGDSITLRSMAAMPAARRRFFTLPERSGWRHDRTTRWRRCVHAQHRCDGRIHGCGRCRGGGRRSIRAVRKRNRHL